jgi:hypothetical protein
MLGLHTHSALVSSQADTTMKLLCRHTMIKKTPVFGFMSNFIFIEGVAQAPKQDQR